MQQPWGQPYSYNSGEEGTKKQDTIFGDIADSAPYEKSLTSTRNWLYRIAGWWVVWGIMNYSRILNTPTGFIILAQYIAVGLVFLTPGLWSRQKTSLAFLVALLFYIVVNTCIFYTGSISFQIIIIIRIVILIALVKGYRDARKYEEIKRTLGADIDS